MKLKVFPTKMSKFREIRSSLGKVTTGEVFVVALSIDQVITIWSREQFSGKDLVELTPLKKIKTKQRFLCLEINMVFNSEDGGDI
mmetsp:Transcript_15814/g.11476  ORF Transcript_15814/g.11476 Transcript_15814/m.11476 type:complete len:85 (-) Transcript_15814:124-378(-)